MNFERETSEALLLEPPRAETFLNSWVTSNPKNAVTGRDNEVGLLPRGNLTDIPSDMSNECVEKQTLSSFCVMFATCALVQCQQLSKWINNAVNRIFRSNILLDFP